MPIRKGGHFFDGLHRTSVMVALFRSSREQLRFWQGLSAAMATSAASKVTAPATYAKWISTATEKATLKVALGPTSCWPWKRASEMEVICIYIRLEGKRGARRGEGKGGSGSHTRWESKVHGYGAAVVMEGGAKKTIYAVAR